MLWRLSEKWKGGNKLGSSYSIFIKTDKSILHVRSQVEDLLNSNLEQSPYDDNEHFCTKLLGLSVGLLHCDYEDCSEIKFSDFNFELMADYIKPMFINNYKGKWDITFLIVLADALSKHLHCECLVIKDVGQIITRFTPGQEIGMPYPEN